MIVIESEQDREYGNTTVAWGLLGVGVSIGTMGKYGIIREGWSAGGRVG